MSGIHSPIHSIHTVITEDHKVLEKKFVGSKRTDFGHETLPIFHRLLMGTFFRVTLCGTRKFPLLSESRLWEGQEIVTK